MVGFCQGQWRDRLQHAAKTQFGNIGVFCHRRAYVVCAVTLTLFFGLSVGMVRKEEVTETSMQALWADQNSRAMEAKRFVDTMYEAVTYDMTIVITNEPSEGDFQNTLTTEGFDLAWRVHQATLATVQEGVENATFEHMCIRVNDKCRMGGVLAMWGFNRTKFDASTEKLADAFRQEYPSSGVPVYPPSIMWGSHAGSRTSKSMVVSYSVKREAWDWMAVWLKNMEEITATAPTPWRIYRYCSRSEADEFARAVQGDLGLNGAAYLMLIVAVTVMVSRRPASRPASFRAWLVGLRLGLVIQGTLLLVLSITAGYGFCMLLSVPFISVHQVLPFIILGVCMDNVIIITDSFDVTPSTQRSEERARLALEQCGMTITLSSFTNVAVMLCGLTISFPGVKYFCAYAAASLFFNYVLMIVVFPICVSKDMVRQDVERAVVGSCGRCPALGVEGAGASSDMPQLPLFQNAEDGPLRKFVAKIYAPWLLRFPVVKVLLLVTFVGYGIFSVMATRELSTEFDVSDSIPDDSYLRDFMKLQNSHLQTEYSMRPVYMYYRHKNYHEAAVQRSMEKMEAELGKLSMVQNVDGIPAVLSWFAVWRDYRLRELAFDRAEIDSPEKFGHAVRRFLEIFPVFSDDIVFENGIVVASRIRFFVDKGSNIKMTVGASSMTQLWDFVDAQSNIDPAPEPYGFWFPYWYSADTIVKETALTLIWSLVGVALVCAIMLPDVFAVLLMVFILAVVCIDLTGVLWLMGLDLNSISLCNLAMCIGLVVDYNAHIILAYYNVGDSCSRQDESTDVGRGAHAAHGTSQKVEEKPTVVSDDADVADIQTSAVVSVDATVEADEGDAAAPESSEPTARSAGDTAAPESSGPTTRSAGDAVAPESSGPTTRSAGDAVAPESSGPTTRSADERMVEAMAEMAPNIGMGASTTLLGVLVLGFAKSFVFRLFFQMFVAIVTLGVLHGLVFVPVAITLFDALKTQVTRSRT